MRKHLIFAALAAIGALVISSCEREKDIETYTVKADEVSLVLGGIATRSAEYAPAVRNNYDLGEVIEGVKLTLEEVVTEMGDLVDDTPETRGTPAYSQNVTQVHGTTFNGEIHGASGRVVADGPFNIFGLSGGRNAWRREIGFDPWQKAGGAVTFFLHMPATQTGVTNLAANYAANSIEFDYATPAKASDQQDILFASRNLDYDTYVSEYQTKGGSPVLFRHALTGVKFAIGNNTTLAGNRTPEDEIQTFITKVEIKGLKDKGHAKFVPAGTETTTDDTDEFSSASSFTWSNLSSTDLVFTQTYGDDNIVDFASGDAVNAPGSFYDGGANRNLNDDKASLTFWFIPQTITADLEIAVTVKVWHGEIGDDGVMSTEREIKLKMGELILAQAETNRIWKAGQLRTFTLKPNIVNVDIDDDVNGFVKKDVVITNTGNVNAYIRANIVANWWGKTDAGIDGVALGYSTEARTDFVSGWELDFDNKSDNYGGEFVEFPGSSDWVYAQDGFFYYKNPVAPGQQTGSYLFKEYHISEDLVPVIYYLSSTGVKAFNDVRLVMDLTVQAIEAKDNVSWDVAWEGALGQGNKPQPRQ